MTTEPDAPVIPDFAGRIIEIAKLDWQLHLWTDDNWEFVISQPVLVVRADDDGVRADQVEVAVEEQPLPEPLAELVGQRIDQVLVARDGHLGIQCERVHLTVQASPSYEAWQLNGPDGEMMICGPGGELTVFGPRRTGD